MRLIYLSHPEVRIDPAVPVPDWSLSARGIARATALARRWQVVRHGRGARLLSSPERKAQETAGILAHHWGVTAQVLEGSGEVNRSATGHVPPARHEALAEALFARPEESAGGWETALAAQQRIVAAVAGLEGEVILVGHGGVGTLLYCHLAGLAISRGLDQPGQGHGWCWSADGVADAAAGHGWRRYEALGG